MHHRFIGLICLLSSFFINQSFAFSGKVVAAEGRVWLREGVRSVGVIQQPAIVETLSVKRGDLVEAGQVIAQLKGRALQEAQLQDLQTEVARITSQRAVLEAEIELLRTKQSGVEVAKQRALVKQQAAIDNLEGKYVDYQWVIDEKDPPRRDSEEIKFKQKLLKRDITRLQTELLEIAPEYEQQYAVLQAEIAIVEARIEELGTAIKAAKAKLVALRIHLAELTVKASLSGQVLRINAYSGERVGPEGIVDLIDANQMGIEAEVYIDDISRISEGDTANIQGDGFKGVLEGTVAFIGMQVDRNTVVNPDPSAFADRRVVKVFIELSEESRAKVARLLNSRVVVRISPANAG